MAKIVHPLLTDEIEARAYQLESLKTALGGSTLMVMPTGFGKTAVQWMMMAEHLHRGEEDSSHCTYNRFGRPTVENGERAFGR